MFAFHLICTQFTVPVDAINVLLKSALPFRRNGTSFQRPCNVREVVKKRAKDCNVSSILRFQNRHISVTGTYICIAPTTRLQKKRNAKMRMMPDQHECITTPVSCQNILKYQQIKPTNFFPTKHLSLTPIP